jgi:very-short-patch-repair endonuclease
MPYKVDTPDAEIARIAARQHGVVTANQLADARLGRMGVSERCRNGRLHRIHRGVYAVGHRGLSLHGRFMAAVLACGPDAVLSHVSAAVLWELLKPFDGPVHISVPSTSGRSRRPGIYLHRCLSLNPHPEPSPSPSYPQQEGGRRGRLLTTHRHNIPVTTVARTLEDLGRTSFLEPHLLRRATRQAEIKGHRLEHLTTERTRSDLESLFLAIVHRHVLPQPEVNVKLCRWTVDFLWRTEQVVVETDFWGYHRGSVAFKDDHARDLDLRSAGYTVLRYDDAQLEDEPDRVAADVAAALAMSSAPRG